MPTISVIIPVYNTQEYLAKCLDSVLNQTYTDFEIILINDGSTDNSEEIIKEYLEKYPKKIRYYKKENGGLSDARNYGVNEAKGKYLCFVDSDDYLNVNLFKMLKSEIEKKTEVIKYKAILVDNNYKEIEKIDGPIFDSVSGQEAFNYLFSKDKIIEAACLYLYDKDFYIKNKFEFKRGLYHEDFGLIPIILINAKTVSSLNYYGYYYYQNENGIMRNSDYKKNVKKAFDLLIHYDNMLDQVKRIHINEVTKCNIKQYYTNSILLKAKELNNDDLKVYINEIKTRKMLRNIKVKNLRQLMKKIILHISIKFYLIIIG